jgi:nucleoside-diphosphate-sugar epimerase
VFASSAAVYAPADRACVEDVTPIAPLEVYGESKVAGEELVRAFHAETGIPAAILRMTNAIGRRETNPHVVPHIFESLRKSNVIALGNTAPRRDYIDTRDLAAAVVAVADAMDASGVFNVGSGETHAVTDVVNALSRMLGRPIEIVQDASRVRATERMLLAVDTTRIHRATGWSARLTLEAALADLIAAYGLQAAPVHAGDADRHAGG